VVAAFLLFGSPVAAQFIVSGSVVYEQNQQAADRVVVVLRNFTDMAINQTTTDTLGQFSFSVPRGVYYLSIRHAGHMDVNHRVEVGVFSTQGIMLSLRRLPGKKDSVATGPPLPAEYLKIPADARKEYEQGMKLFQQDGKLAEGLARLRKATDLHPQFALAHYGTGLVLLDLDRLEEARDSFERAIAHNEKLVPAYFPLGAILNQQRKFVEAEKLLRRGIEIKEDIWQLHFEFGRAVGYQGRWEVAEKSALRAAELNAAAPKVQLLLANIYFELGKDELALAAAEEFLRLAPTDPLAPQIKARVEEMRARPPQ